MAKAQPSKRPFPTIWIIIPTLFVAAGFTAQALGIDPARLQDLSRLPAYFQDYKNPDFTDLPKYAALMLETVIMGLWGSVINLALALPLTRYAAQNVTPNRFAFRASREFLNFCRAMPDILLALVFTVGFGPGPFAGALALGIHSTGFLGKTFAESIERLPKANSEGLQACGASPWQTLRFSLWPSISRELVGYTAYIVYRNILVATTLGLVGAGGIGVELTQAFGFFQKGKVAAILVLIIVIVASIDLAADQIRKKIS